VLQQNAYPANVGRGSYNCVQCNTPTSPTFPSLIVCIYLEFSKLYKLMVAANTGGVYTMMCSDVEQTLSLATEVVSQQQ